MNRATISVFIVCQDEERNIRRCLESVRWCDEIIIIDSGSKDRTLEICAEFGVFIQQRPWPGYVEQKRFGLGCCTKEWVLSDKPRRQFSRQMVAQWWMVSGV